MRTIFEGVHSGTLRVQPWTVSNHRSPGKHYDFRKHPELIRTSLEEFTPYSSFEGVESFYSLIESLNDSNSPFETNDARLTNHMSVNTQRDLVDKAFVTLVEFCFFFRELRHNLAEDSPRWFVLWDSHKIDDNEFDIQPNETCRKYIENLITIIERSSGKTWPQIIGVGTASLHYDEAPVLPSEKYGTQFVIRAWLWGNTQEEVFDGLKNVVSILHPALIKSIPKYK